MSEDPMLKALEAEERKLMAELEQTQPYRRLKLAQQMIAEYRGDPATNTADPSPPAYFARSVAAGAIESVAKHKTKMAQIDAAAADYLTQRGRRATSGELLPAVIAKGITITGEKPSRTLSSYLSNSKRFDNVPGFGGYGLVEWQGRRTAPASTALAPPTPTSSQTPNEVVHESGKLPLHS